MKYMRGMYVLYAGPFPASLGKGPWPKLGNLDRLNNINWEKLTTGSKIYPENHVILDCNMPSIPLKHKCSSV